MTNQAIIQRKVSRGYGKAAKRLGAVFNHYRPRDTSDVLVNINLLETLLVAFDQNPKFDHDRPKVYGDPYYYGLFDLTSTRIGDYFSNNGDTTFFIANFEPLRPSLLIRCNRVISVETPTADQTSGNGYYGGDTQPITKLTNWPAALVQAGIGGNNINQTPGTVNDQGVIIYVPNFAQINAYDVIIDDLQRRYVVGQSELTALGYRLVCRFDTA